MTFANVDPIIASWAAKHGLHMYTRYRDDEVRSVNLVDNKGQKFQIWIEELPDGRFRAVGWDYKKRRYESESDAVNFDAALEKLLAVVRSWFSP